MPQSNSKSDVTTPLSYRWRRACSQFLPIAFFVFVCGTCLLLWQYQNRSIVQIGEVEALNFEVASPAAGIVSGWSTPSGESMPVFSNVTKGQIIIELDDGSLVQDIQTIRRQLNGIKNSTQSKIASLGQSPRDDYLAQTTSKTAALSGPNSEKTSAETPTSPWQKLAQCTTQSLQATSIAKLKLDLRKLDSQIRLLRRSELSTEQRADQTVRLNQQRRELIGEMEAIRIELASSEVVSAADLATERIAAFSEAERMFFQSAAQRCEMLEQQISVLKDSTTRLDIRSPIDGQVEKSMVSQYDAVTAGATVASIAPTKGEVIVVYARETGPVRPFAGDPIVCFAPKRSYRRSDPKLNPSRHDNASIRASKNGDAPCGSKSLTALSSNQVL